MKFEDDFSVVLDITAEVMLNMTSNMLDMASSMLDMLDMTLDMTSKSNLIDCHYICDNLLFPGDHGHYL